MEAFEGVAFDATPRAESCEACGARRHGELEFVILCGRSGTVGRTLCEVCAESVLEAFSDADPLVDARSVVPPAWNA